MPKRAKDQPANGGREQAILQAACAEIRARGREGARMADIARRAGVSYGLAYHYFRSKEDIFNAILEQWWTRLFDRLDAFDRDSSPIADKLRGLFGYLLDEYAADPDSVHVFIAETSRSTSSLSPQRLKTFKAFIGRVERMMTAAQKRGELRADVKPGHLTYLYLGGLEALLSAMVLDNQPLHGEPARNRLIDGMMTVFMNGARPA
ncbi:MAG: TetR/AcrR family transcriptional regulator [Myxococcales bacterium]|nr:MAG: TetR/AcrR family transcriptional regulator [Myxococcales bacterium]